VKRESERVLSQDGGGAHLFSSNVTKEGLELVTRNEKSGTIGEKRKRRQREGGKTGGKPPEPEVKKT